MITKIVNTEKAITANRYYEVLKALVKKGVFVAVFLTAWLLSVLEGSAGVLVGVSNKGVNLMADFFWSGDYSVLKAESEKNPEFLSLYVSNDYPAIMGYYFEAYKDGVYQQIFKDVVNVFSKADLFDYDEGSSLSALVLGVIAGKSFGSVLPPYPSLQLSSSFEKKALAYSYRVGMAALRNGVLKGEIQSIQEVKSTLAKLYSEYKAKCSEIESENVDEKVHLDVNSAPDEVSGHCSGGCSGCCTGHCSCTYSGTFRYVPITSALESETNAIVKEERELKKLECLSLKASILQAKAKLQQSELTLFLTSATYSSLANAEKASLSW